MIGEGLIVGPGTWLIFGVILVPVYGVLIGWFAGSPRDVKTAMLGLGYLFGFTVALWGLLFLKTVLIDVVFF